MKNFKVGDWKVAILCLLSVVMSVFLMAQVAWAGGGFDYGLTISPVPAGGEAKVSSTLGTTYDYGWSNIPASVSVTPWFTPRNSADPPAISSCDAYVYRNGAQWGAERVSASPAQPFVLSMTPPVRWDVKIVCTYANAQPVPVTLVAQNPPPPPPVPSAAAVAPKASSPAPVPATPTPKPVAASPVAKVVSAAAAPVSAPRSSAPAQVAPASAPSLPAVAPAVPSAESTPTASASQVPVGTPLVDAAPASRSVAAKAPVTPVHGGNPLRAILLGVVIALLLLVLVARIKGRRDPLAAYVQVEEAKEESE